mgnify:CR=1 FL=1
MKLFIPIGTLITLVGIFILFRCVYKVAKARNSKLSDESIDILLKDRETTHWTCKHRLERAEDVMQDLKEYISKF